MILVDTSVWVDHFRTGVPLLAQLLNQNRVSTHPFVLGELAMGSLPQRLSLLADLRALPHAISAETAEVMNYIERKRLFGLGLGLIDAHLLVSAQLTPETSIWTRDRRLADVAEKLSLAARTAL